MTRQRITVMSSRELRYKKRESSSPKEKLKKRAMKALSKLKKASSRARKNHKFLEPEKRKFKTKRARVRRVEEAKKKAIALDSTTEREKTKILHYEEMFQRMEAREKKKQEKKERAHKKENSYQRAKEIIEKAKTSGSKEESKIGITDTDNIEMEEGCSEGSESEEDCKNDNCPESP